MKYFITIMMIFFINSIIAQNIDYLLEGKMWTRNDTFLIKKEIENIKDIWEKENLCISVDSIHTILSKTDVFIIPLFFLNKETTTINDLSKNIEKKDKYPFYSILLTYKDVLIGECQYDVISHKYRTICSTTFDKKGLKTRYYDFKYNNIFKGMKVFAITTGYKFPKFENAIFFESNNILKMINYYEKDLSKASTVDKSFLEN